MITHIFTGAYSEYWAGPLRWCHQCSQWVPPEAIFEQCLGPVFESCHCCMGIGDGIDF